MPRTLPWMTDAPKARSAPRSTTVTPKRRRDPSPGDLVNSDLEDLTTSEPPARRSRPKSRTPSTSPPPGPPEVTLMHEGYDADDSYRMVEDEFFATAKLFTNHIHFQEYVRLKKLARARGKDALAGLRRGTDGKTEKSTYLKLKEEANENARARGDLADSESEDDEDLMDAQLAGLMTRGQDHQSKEKDLSSLILGASKTRAAAGFTNSPQKEVKTKNVFGSSPPTTATSSHKEVEEDEETDDDDLNNPPPVVADAGAIPFPIAGSLRIAESKARSADQRPANLSRPKPPFQTADKKFDTSILEDKRAQAAKYLAERNQLRQQKRDKEKRRESAKNVEIPTFLL